MTLALDTNVLVSWAMAGSPRHEAARRLLSAEVRGRGGSLALTPQVVHEFLHVATDPRRFENPLSMREALRLARQLWDAEEVIRLVPLKEYSRTPKAGIRFVILILWPAKVPPIAVASTA